MRKAPWITGDGQLVDVGEVHFNADLAAPQVSAVMRFEHTSDTLRGLARDICARARGEQCPLTSFLEVSGRSGHSRIGIDVQLTAEPPLVIDAAKRIDVPIRITALNKALAESLADLGLLARKAPVAIGRLFIPLSESLPKAEILEALDRHWLLLPERHEISEDGVIEIPLQAVRYILSSRLLGVESNFSELIVKGKHGLGLIQNLSPAGLPELLGPKEFLVSAVHISLGPYTAFIQRELSDRRVFHLASRLLDGIRTTDMRVLRQVELYNQGEEPVSTRSLKVRIRLYPADERVARIAGRVLAPAKAGAIIERGADFAELTDIFNPEVCRSLFDEITASPGSGGFYGRIFMPESVISIPWEHEGLAWLPEFQWRLVFEYAHGKLREGVLDGDEIPVRLRAFISDLKYVGGEQKLSNIFVAHGLPPLDTLRVLKRNGIGVVVARGVDGASGEQADRRKLCLDQALYEEILKLEREGMRFYLLLDDGEGARVREFHQGLWVTERGKERLARIHTTVAMFGSTVDCLKELLRDQLTAFLARLKDNPRLGEALAVAHGSGPGVMLIVDEVAERLDILRIGVGIDAEEIGQASNLRPEAILQFVNLAMNTRQDILDRRSIFKVFNIGGFGTSYEINMALTFMKIGHCLPAPYVFVDPLGLGVNGGGLWEQTISQFRTLTREHVVGQVRIEPLGPRWVVNCCHLVKDYLAGLEVIERFIEDPARYWTEQGIPAAQVRLAHQNLRKSNVAVPPYIEDAVARLAP